jgi:PAS domain S-box-containing protein
VGLTDEQLNLVVDRLVVAALTAAPDGRIAFANGRCESLFGHTQNELTGMPLELLIPPEQRAAHRKGFAAYVAAPKMMEVAPRPTLRALHKDGHEFPIDIRITAFETDRGPRFFCTVRDVTSIRKLEVTLGNALAELERRAEAADARAKLRAEHLDLFMRHAPAGVAMFDRDMRFLMVSDRSFQDFGIARADIIGKGCYEVFPETDERVRAIHRRGLAGEVIGPVEEPFRHRDGRVDWIRWELHPWRGRDGEVGGIFIFSEVITERKEQEDHFRESYRSLEQRVAERTEALTKAKAEAEHASALKSWFMAAAGHDLRQPLQASRIYLAALEQQLEGAEARDLAAKARQTLGAMSSILDVLLDLGQLDGGTIRPNLHDFRLGDVVHRVIANCQPQAAAKDLSLTCTGKDCVVRSDPALLERVVANIVSNAVRYTESGGVTISCACADGVVQLIVQDTGVGIPDDALDAIFDDYVQLGNSARQRTKGLGLGLSIARRVATLLDHKIDVQSTIGEGSTFTVSLPEGRLDEAAPLAPDGTDKAPSASEKKVLLVDDDPGVSDSLALLLRSFGVTVQAAANGSEAIALVNAGMTPDVLISDYRLPDHDGFEVIRRVRASLGSDIFAVLMTGDTALRQDARPANCALLHKPFEIDELIDLIEAGKTLPPN